MSTTGVHHFIGKYRARCGLTWLRAMQWKEDDDGVSLAGIVLTFVILDADEEPLLELTSPAGGITVTEESEGRFTVTITDEQTDELPVGTHEYLLKATVGSGACSLLLVNAYR